MVKMDQNLLNQLQFFLSSIPESERNLLLSLLNPPLKIDEEQQEELKKESKE